MTSLAFLGLPGDAVSIVVALASFALVLLLIEGLDRV